MDHALFEGRSITRRQALGLMAVAAGTVFAGSAMAGCSSTGQASSASSSAQAAAKALEGKELDIYCGAGMTDPFQKIADLFTSETGCAMNVTFANAAQIQTQITTTEQGDFFIAGSTDELKPVEAYVASSVDLVKHIPVLAVPAGNPRSITGVADLAGCERVLIGDPESTPIGKIAKKALSTAGIYESLSQASVLTTTTTAPQIATALANGEGDAGIVWKENVKSDGVEIVECPDLDALIKTVPAAQLTCAGDEAVVTEFAAFMQTDAAMDVWAEFGYEKA